MTQARYSSPSNPLNHSDPLTLASKPSVFCKLAAQLRELSLGSLELVHLALDEAGSEMGAVGDAFRGEDVHIAKFVLRGLEIGELYMALVDQRLNAKVDGAEADAQLLGNLALRGIGMAFKQAQDPEVHVFAQSGDLVTDHGVGRYRLRQSYRTAGESTPSATAANHEVAGATRSFLNVRPSCQICKGVFRWSLEIVSANHALTRLPQSRCSASRLHGFCYDRR